jgi:5-formyltetrahydrofolate cyclo-ligase
MSVTDIRPLKAELRRKYRAVRTGLSPERKQEMDRQVLRRVRNLWQYRENDTLLTYVSTAIEVDTRALIEAALADGKRVAVPRCVRGRGTWNFTISAESTSWSRALLVCWSRWSASTRK